MQSSEASPSTVRFFLLDAMRLVAACAVMLYHYTAIQQRHWGQAKTFDLFPVLFPWTSYGFLGVEMFFVISGFVIFMSVRGRSVPQFIGSRVGRLYPAYWVAVLATAGLLTWVIPQEPAITIKQVLINLTMLQQPLRVRPVDAVYWTLWIEITFYALMTLLMILKVSDRGIAWVLFAWPSVSFVMVLSESPIIMKGLGMQYASFFAAGMCLYLIHLHGHRYSYWLIFVFNAAIAIRQTVYFEVPSVSANTGQPLSPVGTAFVTAGIFLLVALVTVTPLKHRGMKWMVRAGALTYPLYLIHEWWGWWMIGLVNPLLGKWPAILCAVALSFALALAIERWIETPLRPVLRRGAQRVLERLRFSKGKSGLDTTQQL